jgi:hypothetical protein
MRSIKRETVAWATSTHALHELPACDDPEGQLEPFHPGMIRDKSDWSENGSVQVKQQMQSEYWNIVYYSLLISMSSFLISSIWKDRTSALHKGDEVTVEPGDKSVPDSVEAVDGSFFAVVEMGSREVGSDILYTVRMSDGELIQVQRQHLRRRRWYRIAFLQVTNDKKYD